MSDNPFASLNKKLFPKQPGKGEPRKQQASSVKPASLRQASSDEDETRLFLQAVAGNAPHKEEADEFAALFGKGSRAKPVPAALRARPASPPSEAVLDAAQDELFMAAVNGCRPKSHPEQQSSVALSAAAAPDDEDALFASAMADVGPVNARGRDVPSPPVTPAPDFSAPSLESLLHKDVEFSVEFTDEYYEGRIAGLDPAVMVKMRSGQFSPEGHLDLHGQNLEQAYASLSRFVRDAYGAGKRHLLLITGRGKNSPGGDAVIRERVQTWLTRDPFKRVVLAFCSARQRDGGAGALYLLLRKRKKAHGKIQWDRVPGTDDLLL